MAVIAVVVASGFEQVELTALCKELADAGHRVRVVSPKKHMVRAWDNTRWDGDIPVDVGAMDATADDFDALALPGGLISADTLRSDPAIVALVSDAAAQGKPVAAMGHSVWVLIEAGLVRGRKIVAHPAIRTDVVNAGGTRADTPVAEDRGIITGGHGHDIRAFIAAIAQAVRP